MTLPSLFLGLVLSSLYGAAFHLWKGGSLKKLLLYLILGWAGFWAGHLLAANLGWTFLALGPLNTGMATLGSALLLFLGDWLSRVEVQRK
jgi:H+/Cl- antiporter ClcA